MQYPPNEVPLGYGREFINDPTRVRRALDLITRPANVADYIFPVGDANNGGVVYDRVTKDNAYDARQGKAQERAPGTEFTQIDVGDHKPIYDVAKEYGAEIEIPLRTISRSDNLAITRAVNKLGDAVVARIDDITMRVIENDPDTHTYTVDNSWASSTADVIGDLLLARGMAEDNETDNPELTYNINTVVVNKGDLRRYLHAKKEVREELTKADSDLAPILSPYFSGFLDMEWIPSTRVPSGTLWMVDRDKAGALGDEDNGIQTDDWDDKKRRVRVYQAWRAVVPYITDPGAIIKVQGFGA